MGIALAYFGIEKACIGFKAQTKQKYYGAKSMLINIFSSDNNDEE